MHLHLSDGIDGRICQQEEAGITTETLDFVDCPDCLKIIRKAAIKLHSRRKKNMDMVIIRRVLVDNHSMQNTSAEDWQSYQERLYELEEEIKTFNPDSAIECMVMSLITEAMEADNGRG